MSPLIICITGAPRTGTHLVNSILCTSSRVPPMLSEALPVIDMLAAWKNAARHFESHADRLGISLPQIAQLYAGWLRGLAVSMAERFSKDVVVLRGPLLAKHMEALVQLLQGCGLPYRVITMVRWPPDAVASLAVWGAKLKSSGKGGPLVADNTPEGLATFWMQYYVEINRLAREPGLDAACIKMVRYEDLVGAPEQAVPEIGSFLGVDLSSFDQADGWKNSLVPYTEALGEFVTPLYGRPIIPHSLGAGDRQFNDEERGAILRVCGDVASAYYPERL